MSKLLFSWYGEPFQPIAVDSATSEYLGVRVYFTDYVKNDAEVIDPDNYTITPNEAGAIEVGVISATLENYGAANEHVYLECQDMTQDKEYLVTVAPNKIQDVLGLGYVSAGNNTATYDGVSVLPIVQTVTAVSDTIVDVTFSKAMSKTDDLRNATKYSFDKGLRVLGVTIISAWKVRLTTSQQSPSELYTLTVTS